MKERIGDFIARIVTVESAMNMYKDFGMTHVFRGGTVVEVLNEKSNERLEVLHNA